MASPIAEFLMNRPANADGDAAALYQRAPGNTAQYGVEAPEYAANPTRGSNIDTPRREYYMRNEAIPGNRPKTKVIPTFNGTAVMGSTSVSDPSQVKIDIPSHNILKLNPDITRVHEGSHQDVLFAGRDAPVPYSDFVENPIGPKPITLKDILGTETPANTKTLHNLNLEAAVNEVGKKYKMGGFKPSMGGAREFLADLKAQEAALPAGGDISSTPAFKEVAAYLKANNAGDEKTLKQWYLYNHTPGFGVKALTKKKP